MKRRYETILLFDIDAGEETREAFLNRSKALIEQYDGALLEKDEWGVRKLAYEVRRKNRGYYVRLDYCSKTEMVEEFERISRLEDSVMKYLTILLEDTFDLERYERNQSQALSSDVNDEESSLETQAEENSDESDESEETDDNKEIASNEQSEVTTDEIGDSEDKDKEE